MNSHSDPIFNRANEVSELIGAVRSLVHPFIRAADIDSSIKGSGHGIAVSGGGPRTALIEHHPPQKLGSMLNLQLPEHGLGRDGLLAMMEQILKYSVNTWDQGFMDKLYGSTNAVGVASELLLSVLNTNVHVYQVSPVLTLIEKHTTRALAELVGFENAPHKGGISQPGGSASNATSIIIARNTKFPDTKTNGYGSRRFVLFTSAHGHYSLEKAAQMFGFGSNAVRSVLVDEHGCMIPSELSKLIEDSRSAGETPLYVNATAGTTVLGSFDPIDAIAAICKKEDLWLHVDGSWGGPVIFSEKVRKERLKGIEKADTVAITPHKMLGVPLTCSFLLGKDLRDFHRANTLPAGYLFHNSNSEAEIYDLADLTPQCGRKGDALKMFLGWTFYGREGYAKAVERTFDAAQHLFDILSAHPDFVMVSKSPLPCLQVCFHWAKNGKLSDDYEANGKLTQDIAQRLIPRGWMIDYAPGDKGKFFRVVVGRETKKETIDGLVKVIEQVAEEIRDN